MERRAWRAWVMWVVAGVLAGCAGSGEGGGGVVVGAERSTPAPGRVPREADTAGTIARSTLRERAIALLEGAAFDEWALIRANALEGLHPVPRRAEPIARAALVDENLGVRYVGAMTVGRLGLGGSVAQVRPLLDDPDVSVRLAAIYALTRNGVEVDRTLLAETLLEGPFRVRSQAAFILGELGDPSAVPLLRDAARRLRGPEAEEMPSAQRRLLRLQIAEALANLGEREVLHTLRAALYPSSPDEFEATALAVQILGRLEDEDSAAQLIQLVEYTTPDSARSDDPEEREYVYPAEVRLAAATALARMGFRDGAYVAEQYEEEPAEAIRAQAAFLYGAVGGVESIERLRGMLEDGSILVRVASAAALLEALSG